MSNDNPSEVPRPGRVFISGGRVCILGSRQPIYPGFWRMSKVPDPNSFAPEFDASSVDFHDDAEEEA